MANKQQNITRYLSLRLGLLFVLFVLVWTEVARWVYQHAWDDTTEFYLHQDLEMALSGQLMLPYAIDGKYIGKLSHMPSFYRNTVENNDIPYAHTALFDIQLGDLYVLKEHSADGDTLYVVHYFAKAESPSLIPFFLILAATMLLPLGFVIWRICASVSKEADNLINGVTNNEAKPARFAEFQQLATILKTAQYAQQHALEQERLFAAFLSHEIRTPLTKISHSMSRIEQVDDLPFEALDVLDTLEESQKELSKIAEAILLLSRPNVEQLQPHDLSDILEGWRGSWLKYELEISINGRDEHIVQAIHPTLFTLLLTQIAKNALQHGCGPIDVTVTCSSLRFENDIRDDNSTKGHGLGSKIIKQVCDCFGWEVKQSSQRRYVIEINF
ncbi:sensor histidine kinase [Pseudoalteromonas luteoviolacea]|uniref:sensor histidine kinase n=1 Tax=Pseudoalteromonas luteoviolacea TaxID=43657 RepID=UPI0011546534|nr:HAMP domain-containing sensor histidine kinase [Pseudoalteromonas luteoviolacea]TQF67969.1 HAMP domain-containing histidine kinase [Pseudoalteromonas luteoviolacea]